MAEDVVHEPLRVGLVAEEVEGGGVDEGEGDGLGVGGVGGVEEDVDGEGADVRGV